jgi:hypothetical protein
MQQNKIPAKYDKLAGLNSAMFKRLTGVKRTTFETMIEILRIADQTKKAVGGRKSKLTIEDRLLMALEYLREYRTYFHIGQSYGVSESNAYKICRFVEDTLIKDKRFALPGKKALLKSDTEYEVVLIDVAESPIERPKKDRDTTTQVKRNGTLSRLKSLSTNRPKPSSVPASLTANAMTSAYSKNPELNSKTKPKVKPIPAIRESKSFTETASYRKREARKTP